MRRIKYFFIMCLAVLGAVSKAHATFSISQFSITNANQNNKLIVPDATKPTPFRANYTLNASNDGMFNVVYVDVIFRPYDNTPDVSLGTAKVYSANTGQLNFTDYVDVQLPANKTNGAIMLRVKATSPQTLFKYSDKVYGIEVGPGTPTDPIINLLKAWRASMEPRGNVYDNPATAEYTKPSMVAVYVTVSPDGKRFDLYPDLALTPGWDLIYKKLPTGNYVIRKEFYAYTQPETGTIPIYRYVKKVNNTITHFSNIPQDEAIWTNTGIAFYAYSTRVPRDGSVYPAGIDFMKHMFSTYSMDRSYFGAYFPDELAQKEWLPPYEMINGVKVRRAQSYADFQAFPAFIIK